jgi:regulator of RNase E activity RraA
MSLRIGSCRQALDDNPARNVQDRTAPAVVHCMWDEREVTQMDHQELRQRFATLTTAHLADACIRAQVPVRCAPAALSSLAPGTSLAGRVAPARHVGSVDVFLEALEEAAPGDVLVVDNGGRLDEACVGDLVALEAQAAGLEGIVIWGLHRDTADLRAIGLAVFSLGAVPTGPQRLDACPPDALRSATVGEWTVDGRDLVMGDDDGVLFLPAADAGDVFSFAEQIRDTERRQAERLRAGVSLRSQVQFAGYLARRGQSPTLSFREHLRVVGGAIEE